MKRILLVLCTIILVASGVMSQSPEQGVGPQQIPSLWRRYTVKGEEFSVQLPLPPAMTTTATLQPRFGKHRLERHLQTTLQGVLYTIDAFEKLDPKQTLEEFITEQNLDAEYDLKTERGLTVNDIVGKEYSSGSKTTPAAVQFFATERRFYRFTASRAGADHPGVKQFFSSIQLGKKQDGVEVSDGPGSSTELNGERIYTSKELDVKPRLTAKPEPSYTEDARYNRISGVVVLRALFSKTGKVTNIRVLSGLPHGLTEKAIEAAKKIEFVPGIKDGQYVSMWVQLEYNFNP